MCCSNVHPFCFISLLTLIHTPQDAHPHHKCGVRIITTSQIDIKGNICLTEEHGANKALTYTDLSLQSLPSTLTSTSHCCHSQKMSRDTPCSYCYCSLDIGISTVPMWFEPTKSCHFVKSLPICLVFKNETLGNIITSNILFSCFVPAANRGIAVLEACASTTLFSKDVQANLPSLCTKWRIMEWLGLKGTLKLISFHPPAMDLPLSQGAQSPIQPCLEQLQGRGIHSLSDQPVSGSQCSPSQ